MNTQAAAKILTYAGALPFIGTIAVLVIDKSQAFPFDIEFATQVYAALLISFLAGIHWHIGISHIGAPRHLLFISNAFVLLAWGFVFLQTTAVSWILFAILFLGLIVLDRALSRMGLLPKWFFHLRINISVLVCTALLCMAVIRTL
ncbi:MAG: DUF3429 domain-containing protein [Arenicellales bacterium]|nr:DUF3429 domain-containing protein [Arenicellales bacterium]